MEGAHIPSPSHEFISPDLPLLDAELIDDEPTPSLVEQGLIPHAHRSNPVSQPQSTVRRDSRGQMKRLQPRTGETPNCFFSERPWATIWTFLFCH